MSAKDNDEERVIHSKSDNIEIMIKYNANEVIEKHFESLLKRYQVELEKSMKGIDFILDYIFILYFLFIFIVHLLCYKFHEIDFKWGGSLFWLNKNQKGNNKSYQ